MKKLLLLSALVIFATSCSKETTEETETPASGNSLLLTGWDEEEREIYSGSFKYTYLLTYYPDNTLKYIMKDPRDGTGEPLFGGRNEFVYEFGKLKKIMEYFPSENRHYLKFELLYDAAGRLIQVDNWTPGLTIGPVLRPVELAHSNKVKYNSAGKVEKVTEWKGTEMVREFRFTWKGNDVVRMDLQIFGYFTTSTVYTYNNKISIENKMMDPNAIIALLGSLYPEYYIPCEHEMVREKPAEWPENSKIGVFYSYTYDSAGNPVSRTRSDRDGDGNERRLSVRTYNFKK